MFCPNCGKGEQAVNSYCRDCGEWLPDVKKSVSLAFGGSSPAENIRITLFLNALGAVVCLAMAVALVWKYYGTSFFESLITLAATLFFVIAVFQISNIYALFKLRRSLLRRRYASFNQNNFPIGSKREAALPAANTGELIYAPTSVIENTTGLLEPIARKQQNQ